VGLSHERSDIAGAESLYSLEGNMCGTVMRGAVALPGSKATSRASEILVHSFDVLQKCQPRRTNLKDVPVKEPPTREPERKTTAGSPDRQASGTTDATACGICSRQPSPLRLMVLFPGSLGQCGAPQLRLKTSSKARANLSYLVRNI
jgi:hypothetical protein